MDRYLGNDEYERLVTELANIGPCPFAGQVTEDQIRIALGEYGNIWPRSIEDDALRDAFEERGFDSPTRFN